MIPMAPASSTLPRVPGSFQVTRASGAYAARAIGMGFRMVSVLNDARMMAAHATATVAQVRKDSKGVA